MAEKISTLIISVDLECRLCDKRIRKTLKKFPEIQIQTFEVKKNTVTVSGAFDAEQVSKCLRCLAGKSIKDIHIVKAPPPKPKFDPPKPKPDPSPPEKPKEGPPKTDSAEPKGSLPKPDPAKPDAAKLDPLKVAPSFQPVYQPWFSGGYDATPCPTGWPYYPMYPSRDYYQYSHQSRGNSQSGDNELYVWGQPTNSNFFSEEEQSCAIM